jgi:iron complex transport system ATP-binding protein
VSASFTPGVQSEHIVTLKDVAVTYGDTKALRGIRHSVTRGEWLGLIGANGAGKTTFLKAIAQLLHYDGIIEVDHRDVSGLSRRQFAQLVAYVPQKPEFPAEMRAIDYVTLGRTPHLGYFGAEGSADRSIARELLERLGLKEMALRPLGTMSGGELQRLVLARALAQEAPVLLLDEPTSALDLGRRVEALELVDELRLERALTVISAMHDLTLAAQFSDRLTLLAHGVVVASGAPHDVLEESSLDRHFGTQVRILRTDDGELVVVPRRVHPKGNYA